MGFRWVYGNSHSENGWRMCDVDECVVANPVSFTNTAPVRWGDAATILNAWLIWYSKNVEPIKSPVWGWSLTNAVGNSNHLSGTAIDINAPQYPWGLRTMPRDRIDQVRRGLTLFHGAVFWGADWDRADEMHYQMNWPEGDVRNTQFANSLNDGYLGLYTESSDMSAQDVKQIQDFVAGFVAPIGSDVKDIREQLAGLHARNKENGYPGWPQLGGKTIVDAIADIRDRLAVLEGKQ